MKHKGKALTTEEVMKERSSAYEFIDFGKEESLIDDYYTGSDILDECSKPKQETVEEITLKLIPRAMKDWGHLPGKYDNNGSKRNTLLTVLKSEEFKKYFKRI